MHPRVRTEIADHVAVVTLDRPEKHNALDVPMFAALQESAAALRDEADVHAVVLHGEGKSFCSGLDLESLARAGDTSSSLLMKTLSEPPPNFFQRAAHSWLSLPVPVIAAVHGNCFGGGLQVALAADIRICAPDARLSVMEIRWGLIPDLAITRTLPRLVGIDVAKELTYTGRIVSGEEAAALGLVTRCDPEPLRAAGELAATIAAHSPAAVTAAKRLYDESWTGAEDATLALEAKLQSGLISSARLRT